MRPQWITQVATRYRQVAAQASQQSPFSQQLHRLSRTPLAYEDQDLLDYALECLPLDKLYAQAEKAHEHATDGSGLQDCLIKELLAWFRNEFFTWVNAPACEVCGSDTESVGVAAPNPQEQSDSAGRVEIYKCKHCAAITRFPRYTSPRTLLQFRKGRCGEWANCFTLLCRALGSRARWVWNAEDHVWTEVYSETQHRWIHADSCETAWDQPQLYERGWGKKMSYAIAFSCDGAQDVSTRYIRSAAKQLPRNKISEIELFNTIQSINAERRTHLSDQEKEELAIQDEAEQDELFAYTFAITPSSTAELRPRETGAGEWTAARGENGTSR